MPFPDIGLKKRVGDLKSNLINALDMNRRKKNKIRMSYEDLEDAVAVVRFADALNLWILAFKIFR